MAKNGIGIAVDIMGTEDGPAVALTGVELAYAALHKRSVRRFPKVYLVGPRTITEQLLRSEQFRQWYELNADYLMVSDAPDIITMSDPPSKAARGKSRSSIHRGIDLVRQRICQAFVSAGNTGAVMAVSFLKLRCVSGIDRPAIAVVWPSARGPVLVLDAGANSECSPKELLHFGVMGSIYVKHVLHLSEHTVGLLNMGTEVLKGNDTLKKAHTLLVGAHEDGILTFTGNVEADKIFPGVCQVFVCDGLVGNSLLKMAKSILPTINDGLKQDINNGRRDQKMFAGIGKFLLAPTLGSLKRRFNYATYGGAPLLGVQGNVVIAHGSSSAEAFGSAIGQAYDAADHNVAGTISSAFRTIPTGVGQ